MNNENEKPLIIMLPAKLKKEFKQESARREVSMKIVVTKAIEQWLQKQEKQGV